jgi:hypothetical protein
MLPEAPAKAGASSLEGDLKEEGHVGTLLLLG